MKIVSSDIQHFLNDRSEYINHIKNKFVFFEEIYKNRMERASKLIDVDSVKFIFDYQYPYEQIIKQKQRYNTFVLKIEYINDMFSYIKHIVFEDHEIAMFLANDIELKGPAYDSHVTYIGLRASEKFTSFESYAVAKNLLV